MKVFGFRSIAVTRDSMRARRGMLDLASRLHPLQSILARLWTKLGS